MKVRLTLFVLLIWAGLGLCETAFAQNSTRAYQTVTGRVTMNGRGLSGVSISAWPQPYLTPEGAFSAKTDSDGKYQLKLPPGTYFAAVSSQNFVEVENGKAFEQLRTLTVTPNETPSDFDFEVGLGGVITGRITDADNVPLIEITVELISTDPNSNASYRRSMMQNAIRVQTDDRGIYRFFGVLPGRYRLAVGDTSVRRGQPPRKRRFYPDSYDEVRGAIIEITSGKELTGFDMKLPPLEKTFTVKARIVDEETGQPVVNISCALDSYVNDKVTGSVSVQNLTNKNGECLMEHVLPGSYRITVPGPMFSTGSRPNQYGRSGLFAVIDQDVVEIVKAARGISVSGVVVIEGKPDPKLQAMLQNKQFGMSSIPLEPGQRISGRLVSIQADGSFFMDGLAPGRLSIGMTNPSETFPFMLTRTEHQGVEQKDQIQLKAGDQITDLRLVLAYATGEIRGTARLSTGTLPGTLKGTAMLYRDGKFYFGAHIDSRGQFLFQRVPAGNYQLVLDVKNEGPQRISARAEQMIEVANDKVSEVVIVMDPKTTPEK